MAKPDKSKKHGECDDNTERPLIDLIKTLLTVEFKKVNDALENFGQRLQQQEQKQDQIMTGLENVTAAVTALHDGDAALTTAVNAIITQVGQPGSTDAQLNTLAAVISSKTASDAALVSDINAALAVPPPAPTT